MCDIVKFTFRIFKYVNVTHMSFFLLLLKLPKPLLW